MALLTGVVVLWLPNWQLLTHTFFHSSLTGGERLKILFSLLGSLETNFTPLTRLAFFLLIALIGIQFSLTFSYIREITHRKRSLGTPLLGILIGIIGIGCASCGSIVITSVFGLGATVAFLSVLPFHGHELALLGFAVLGTSLWYTTRKMTAPEVCAL